jgi:hypothetical protein
MCKTLVGTTTMSGFMFIIVVGVASCQVDKVLVLTKLGLKVVPNSFLLSGWSILPSLLKVLTNFLLACHLGI